MEDRDLGGGGGGDPVDRDVDDRGLGEVAGECWFGGTALQQHEGLRRLVLLAEGEDLVGLVIADVDVPGSGEGGLVTEVVLVLVELPGLDAPGHVGTGAS